MNLSKSKVFWVFLNENIFSLMRAEALPVNTKKEKVFLQKAQIEKR